MPDKELIPNSEIEPQARILFVDLQPLTKQNKSIGEKMFGINHENLEDYKNIEIRSIKAPKPSESDGMEDRERRATIDLPETAKDFKGIVITGSPFAAYSREEAHEGKQKLFVAEWKMQVIKLILDARKRNIPILGICSGCQFLAEALGGKVVEMTTKEMKQVEEVGWGRIKRSPGSYGDEVMKGIEDEFLVPEHHGDVVALVPENATVIAENEYGVQGFRINEGSWQAWGFQFHAERSPSKVAEILKNQGKTEAEILEIQKEYTGSVKKIFNNFLQVVWSQVQ